MNFNGDFFKLTRNLLHLNQQAFANKLGIARPYLAGIESGSKPITRRTENKFLTVLAELDINLFELITMYDSYLRINNQK